MAICRAAQRAARVTQAKLPGAWLHVVIPTTVGTYMRALYSSTTVAAQEERRSTRVYQRRAANPTPGSAVDSRRAGAAEACALHAGNALMHASSTMHNDGMRDALCVVGHKGASSIAKHVRRDIGADVKRIASQLAEVLSSIMVDCIHP